MKLLTRKEGSNNNWEFLLNVDSIREADHYTHIFVNDGHDDWETIIVDEL